MSDATDVKIAALINSYIIAARKTVKTEGVDLIQAAFRDLQNARRGLCLADEISSAAEHYLTARYYTSSVTGPAIIAYGSAAYDALKLIPGGSWAEQKIFGNDCPPSEPTFRQTQWKMYGIADGRVDMIHRSRYIAPVDASSLGIKTAIGASSALTGLATPLP